MDPIGVLTKSGLLYEGNYKEWRESFEATLATLGQDDTYDPGNDFTSLRSQYNKPYAGINTLDLIFSQISPRLLARIPGRCVTRPNSHRADSRNRGLAAGEFFTPTQDTTQHQPFDLVELLRRFARPFRLLDLNAGVRNMIYTHAISSCKVAINIGDKRPSLFHPLTRTGRQVRSETLGLAWSHASTEIPLNDQMDIKRCVLFASRFRGLVKTIKIMNIEFLNLVEVTLLVYRYNQHNPSAWRKMHVFLRLSRAPATEIEVEVKFEDPTVELSPISSEDLHKHFQHAVEISNLMGHSCSDALLSALFGSTQIWRAPFLTFQPKRLGR